MRLKIFALFLLVNPLLRSAHVEVKLYCRLECPQGQNCIRLACGTGKTESVVVTPEQALEAADIRPAGVQMGGNNPPSLAIELSKESSERLERITGANRGKKLMIVFDREILTAPALNVAVGSRRITIDSGDGEPVPHGQKAPRLQSLSRDSSKGDSHSVIFCAIIALALSISAFLFVLLPRMRRVRPSNPE
jgi:hypothetical protein